jgi:hypothetical protein
MCGGISIISCWNCSSPSLDSFFFLLWVYTAQSFTLFSSTVPYYSINVAKRRRSATFLTLGRAGWYVCRSPLSRSPHLCFDSKCSNEAAWRLAAIFFEKIQYRSIHVRTLALMNTRMQPLIMNMESIGQTMLNFDGEYLQKHIDQQLKSF